MTIELVTKPWVGVLAQPQLNLGVMEAFAEEHGLEEFAGDFGDRPDTPIGRIFQALERDDEASHADLLTEFSGRFCYRAWDKGRSTGEYLKNIISERHGSVLAHSNVSFIITGVSRSLTHELVRHHVGTNPSQESQRYVTAEGGEIEIVGFKANRAVVPPLIMKMAENPELMTPRGESVVLTDFLAHYENALDSYQIWLDRLKGSMSARFEDNKTIVKKRAQEAARCFLPNASETRLVWTMNLRAARNVIEQRGNPGADLEIRRLAVAFTPELKRVAPETFFDCEVYTAADGFEAVRVEYSKV